MSDPKLYEFLPIIPPRDVSELRSRLERYEHRISRSGLTLRLGWMARLRANGAYVGYLVSLVRQKQRRAAVGYVVFRRFWGRGIAQEALSRILRVLFRDYRISRIHAIININNSRSIAVARNLGFRKVRSSHKKSGDITTFCLVAHDLKRPRTTHRF